MELAVPVQHVGHDLEVDVRRPVAVSRRRPDRADALPAGDLLTRRQRLETVGSQVAVQRVEAGSALGRVLEDDGRAVVVARGVVVDGVHAAGQRSVHGRAGLHEDVQGDVHGAALGVLGGHRARRGGERVAAVDEPRFVVAADPDVGPRLAHLRKEPGRHGRGVEGLGGSPELRAGDRQVEDDRPAEVGRDDRREFSAVLSEPGLDRGRLRAGRAAAGISQSGSGETRMDLGHAAEGFPGRGFAHEQVGVVGLGRAAVRGKTDARAEAHRSQDPDGIQLRLRERALRVVAGHDALRRHEGLGLAEDAVGHGDRELADRPRLDHVAEIEKPRDRAVLGPLGRRTDEDVVVVGVVVDDAPRELREAGARPPTCRAPRTARRARGGRDPRSRPDDAR